MLMRYGLPIGLLLACSSTGAPAQTGVPRPEHPRPDFERNDWLCLNGPWQFEIDADATGESRGLTTGKDLSGEILVPFCPESALSGIGHTDFIEHVWYRRLVDLPASMTGKRLRLHFGAVDWHARVWVNGAFVGEHRGGYTPFAFEITDLVGDGPIEIVLTADDYTRSGNQATGKQSQRLESHGCVYTRTTGIWQTVWLEAVGETYLEDFSLVTDPDTGTVVVQGDVNGPGGATLTIDVLDGGKTVASKTVKAAGRSTLATLTIEDPKLWWPEDPFLYDVRFRVQREGKVVDEVRSYLGVRKVHLEGHRFLINGKPVFQRTVLDQGFYPDGIYTAPTDDALRGDIELSMAAGFNGARLHQKVFEPRFLYWADKLGYLVWGEFPDWGVNREDGAAIGQMVTEWHEAVKRDRNHPAIVGWCPLNEVWSGSLVWLAQEILKGTQLIDPTRPTLDGSGGTHYCIDTDVYDGHNYDQNPVSFAAHYEMFKLTGKDAPTNKLDGYRTVYRGQPYFVSEYGGTAFSRKGEGAWGYGAAVTDEEEFFARYKGLTDALLDNPYMFGFCYTQLTDVEQEQNGVYYYDRGAKYDVARLKEINEREAAYERDEALTPIAFTELLPTAETEARTWRYTTDAPAENWMAADFDASAWSEGPGGFGVEGTTGAIVGTTWDTPDVWLRQSFEYLPMKFDMAFIRIHHDEDAEVYVNGVKVLEFKGYGTTYALAEATEALREALQAGENVLAIHCKHGEGGRFIDAGLVFGSR